MNRHGPLEHGSQMRGTHSKEQTRRGGLIRDVWPLDENGRPGDSVSQCVHGTTWRKDGVLESGEVVTCRPCLHITQEVWRLHREAVEAERRQDRERPR